MRQPRDRPLDSIFAKFLHNQLHDFTDVPEGFLLGVAPCCGAVPVERRTMGMPAAIIRLDHDLEGIGPHWFQASIV